MRHIKMNTLYPFLEMDCPVCGELSDHPVDEVDCQQIQSSVFDAPVCHCGHKFCKVDVDKNGVIYG